MIELTKHFLTCFLCVSSMRYFWRRRDGVSRLSAHLHVGMVSPFRVARDAMAAQSYGAGKFVDEFLTWREVAYAFCFHHTADLDSLKARAGPGSGGRQGLCFVDVPSSLVC